jgi:hypothetical protein
MRLAFAILATGMLHAAEIPASRVPVIVELFTSEGCSSCPPADDLLVKLEKMQPVPGAQIIALSEHVDYWNRLGWRDPFSSSQFTARQNQYVDSLRQDGPYTPEAVVDGRKGLVGSNSRDAQAAILDALKQLKANVSLNASPSTGGINLAIDIRNIPGEKDSDVVLVITEAGLQSNVSSGENSGRLLRHTGVVRRLVVLGRTKDSTFTSQTSVALPREWKKENLRAVVFVQDHKTHQVRDGPAEHSESDFGTPPDATRVWRAGSRAPALPRRLK